MSPYVVAVSRRYGGSGRYAGPAGGPLRHALHPSRPRASATGSNYSARCGASVASVVASRWDPDHPRACRECRRLVSQP